MGSATRTSRSAALIALALLVTGGRGDYAATHKPHEATTHKPRQEKVATHRPREEKVTLPGFGAVTVYRPESMAQARGVVLFVSGDGGWNQGVVDMARRISNRAIVAGLSMPAWQKRAEAAAGRCWYPAGELEVAAQALEKRLHLPRYVAPVLVGYSSGATVVYGALAQAPATTFAGGVSLGFCPDLEVARTFCGKAEWKPSYDAKKRTSMLPPDRSLTARDDGSPRFIALQGTIDQVCDPPSTERFIAATAAARVVVLDHVGHGFSVPRRWGDAFDAAVAGLLEPSGVLADGGSTATVHASDGAVPDAAVEERLEATGLPLEVSWPENAQEAVVFVSGDGGWADLDRTVAAELTRRGIAVIGWNALRYFWNEKSPRRFADDLARVIAALPRDTPIYAAGYSFGAESLPWAVADGLGRGDAAIARIAGLVLLEPSRYATFEVSPLDWLRSGSEETAHPVADAIAKSSSLPVLCIDGADDAASGCHGLPHPRVVHAEIPGGHHFGGEFNKVADAMARFIASTESSR